MLMNIAKLENYLQIDSSRYNRPSIEALNYYATRFMLQGYFLCSKIRK